MLILKTSLKSYNLLFKSSRSVTLNSVRFTTKVFTGIEKMENTGTGIPLKAVIQKMDEFAPRNLAESWDNVGLLLEPTSPINVNNIFLTNDLTEDVMEEALKVKANLIIAYHPLIFSAIKTINNSTWKSRIIASCFENRIALFSPHTTWDSTENGIGDWLAKCLPLEKCDPIHPGVLPNTGVGRICQLSNPIRLRDAIEKIKVHIGIPHLRLALARGKTIDDMISTMAVCPGSGTSVLGGLTADLYLTGEMLHHDVLEAVHKGSNVILCNHSDSERGYLKHFAEKLRAWFPENVNVLISERDSDPLKTV